MPVVLFLIKKLLPGSVFTIINLFDIWAGKLSFKSTNKNNNNTNNNYNNNSSNPTVPIYLNNLTRVYGQLREEKYASFILFNYTTFIHEIYIYCCDYLIKMHKFNFPMRKDPQSIQLFQVLSFSVSSCSEFKTQKKIICYILRDNCYQIIYGCKMLHIAERLQLLIT